MHGNEIGDNTYALCLKS